MTAGDAWAAGVAYEAYMGRWSRPLAVEFVRWLAPRGGHWLEVGGGTGALTAGLSERAASIVACDPSAAFVAHARAQVLDPKVSFVVAGAEALPERPGGFDGVVSSLVLNFLPDPVAALGAMRE